MTEIDDLSYDLRKLDDFHLSSPYNQPHPGIQEKDLAFHKKNREYLISELASLEKAHNQKISIISINLRTGIALAENQFSSCLAMAIISNTVICDVIGSTNPNIVQASNLYKGKEPYFSILNGNRPRLSDNNGSNSIGLAREKLLRNYLLSLYTMYVVVDKQKNDIFVSTDMNVANMEEAIVALFALEIHIDIGILVYLAGESSMRTAKILPAFGSAVRPDLHHLTPFYFEDRDRSLMYEWSKKLIFGKCRNKKFGTLEPSRVNGQYASNTFSNNENS
jgi:hypothetical protein